MTIVLTTLNAKFIHSSLGLRYLHTYCRFRGIDTSIREYTINNELSHILGELYQTGPQILGMACYIWNRDKILTLAAWVKKVLPHTVIILGGPEATYDSAQLLQDHPAIDYIIQGEGEEVLAEVLDRLLKGETVGELPGLCYRHAGQVVESVPQVVADLAVLPFPYDVKTLDELKDQIIYYETSRGCPFSCQYCLSSATRGVRYFSQEKILQDLEFFTSQGVKQVKFVDRTFNAWPAHIQPILQWLLTADCTTNFHLEISADLLDEPTLALLIQMPSGRVQLEIGIQSTHEATLEAISRKNNWPQITKNVRRLLAAGNIHLHLDLIAGLPYEDLQQFGKSFNAVLQLRPHMLQLGFLKLLHGSKLRREADNYAYVYMDDPPYEVLANGFMSYADIRQLKIMEEIFNQLYNTGRFSSTLNWIIASYGGDGFGFFQELATYWEGRGLHRVSHGVKALHQHLAEFCLASSLIKKELCRDLLRYDALIHDQGSYRPEFLPWNRDLWAAERDAFWRDEQLLAEYVPGYIFTNWRDLKKKYHIEVFTANIPDHLLTGQPLQLDPTPVLFVYGPGDVGIRPIAAEHFWQNRRGLS